MDAETRQMVSGARIRLSRSRTAEEVWTPEALPGPNEANAIYYAKEQQPGLYRLNSAAPETAYHYELQHEHYVKAKKAPPELSLGVGVTPILVQMPVVASIRYVGDDILDGTISYPGKLIQNAESIATLRGWRASLAEKHKGSLTVMFLNDEDSENGSKMAIASCILRHGARRVDQVPVVRLAEFSGPVELQSTALGEAIQLQEVTIKGPPKFGDVDANFKVIINGGKKWPIKVVELGATLSLPPGDYHVIGRGDWAFGALERKSFTVSAGEPVTFDLQWREGVRMYVMQVEAALSVHMVQIESGEGRKKFVVSAPVNDRNVAVFWIRSNVGNAVAHARGCSPADVSFAPTSDPRISRCVCRFVASAGK